jgi:hypothetical protein
VERDPAVRRQHVVVRFPEHVVVVVCVLTLHASLHPAHQRISC